MFYCLVTTFCVFGLQIPTTVLPERDNTLFRIQPLSVTSKVLNPSGNTTLTVEYTSERQPTMEWLFWMYSESMYRTGKTAREKVHYCICGHRKPSVKAS